MPDPIQPATLGLEPESELSRLLERCPEIVALRFRDGELLLREGDPTRDILVVTQGGLVVECQGEPPVVLAQMDSDPECPAIIGEMAYFGEEPRSASVRCVGSTLALRLEPRHVDLVLEGFPGLTRVICRQFSQRLREASRALATLRSGLDLGAERRMLEDGVPLFRAGHPARLLFQLILGRVRVEEPSGARQIAPEDLPGGFLELEPWLRNGAHTVTAIAEGSAFLAEVDQSRRPVFLRRYPELALAILEGQPAS